MKYTEEAKQVLSRKVAEKFGLAQFLHHSLENGSRNGFWLHHDWHTLGDECAKRRMSVDYYDTHVQVVSFEGKLLSKVAYKDCASPSEAERIARLLALAEVTV